jgi:hypothetical protein
LGVFQIDVYLLWSFPAAASHMTLTFSRGPPFERPAIQILVSQRSILSLRIKKHEGTTLVFFGKSHPVKP